MPTREYVDEVEVVPLLTKILLPRWVILELVEQVAGERANVSDEYDPPTAIGYETWRWGTRYSREHEELKKLGWVPCEKHQISGIRNASLKMKLAVCSTDANTGVVGKRPKNINEKGPSTCRLINKNSAQISFLPDEEDEEADELWYLCLHFSKTHIAIEISRPSEETAGTITDYSDRIIIAKPGEIPGIRRYVVPQEFADVSKPTVRRKGD